MKYYAADEEVSDKTEELEDENLTQAGGEDEDEEEEGVAFRSDGQKLYELLKIKIGVIDDGNWDDLVKKLKEGWEMAASTLMVEDLDLD